MKKTLFYDCEDYKEIPGTITKVTGVFNYYSSGVFILKNHGVCYWALENHDGFGFTEIPEYLFDALLRHQRENQIEEARGL